MGMTLLKKNKKFTLIVGDLESAGTKVLLKERNFVSELLTFIFDIERVLLQPANSLLQPAKKVSSAPFTRPWFGGIASGGQNLYYI